jgi:hypothetical protein
VNNDGHLRTLRAVRRHSFRRTASFSYLTVPTFLLFLLAMSVLPRTQVLNSSTFKAPPLGDKSLCLPDLYDWQNRNSPSHPFFVFEDGPRKIRTITWAEAARGIHRAAHLVASRLPVGAAAAALKGRPVIVAALAATGPYITPLEPRAIPFSCH